MKISEAIFCISLKNENHSEWDISCTWLFWEGAFQHSYTESHSFIGCRSEGIHATVEAARNWGTKFAIGVAEERAPKCMYHSFLNPRFPPKLRIQEVQRTNQIY